MRKCKVHRTIAYTMILAQICDFVNTLYGYLCIFRSFCQVFAIAARKKATPRRSLFGQQISVIVMYFSGCVA